MVWKNAPSPEALTLIFEGFIGGLSFAGQALAWDDQRGVMLHTRDEIHRQQVLNWLLPNGHIVQTPLKNMRDLSGNPAERVVANRGLWIESDEKIPALSVNGWNRCDLERK